MIPQSPGTNESEMSQTLSEFLQQLLARNPNQGSHRAEYKHLWRASFPLCSGLKRSVDKLFFRQDKNVVGFFLGVQHMVSQYDQI